MRFYANHTDEEGAKRSFQIMFYAGTQCVEVTEVCDFVFSAGDIVCPCHEFVQIIGKNSGRNAVGSARTPKPQTFLSNPSQSLNPPSDCATR